MISDIIVASMSKSSAKFFEKNKKNAKVYESHTDIIIVKKKVNRFNLPIMINSYCVARMRITTSGRKNYDSTTQLDSNEF